MTTFCGHVKATMIPCGFDPIREVNCPRRTVELEDCADCGDAVSKALTAVPGFNVLCIENDERTRFSAYGNFQS